METRVVDNTRLFLKKMSTNKVAALRAIGEYIKGEMQDRTPVLTGNLRSSNSYEIMPQDWLVRVGNIAEYAMHVEKGTRNMDAQPFLTPAVEENTKTIQKIAAFYLSRV